MKYPLILLLACICFRSDLYAQNRPVPTDTIYSQFLKEKRLVQVVMPADYQAGDSKKYDVLYVLDGEANTEMTRVLGSFLRESNMMPANILVGVYNTDRTRDFTPTRVPENQSAGGADNFLSFLEKELIPYINKKYPTNGSNGIFGHSLGGLFAVYVFLTKPIVFDSYIAADPSFWWDSGFINKLAKEKFDPAIHTKKSLWITGRGGKGSEEMAIPPMDTILTAKAGTGLHWKSVAYPGETHNSIKFKTVYDGLRFMYEGFNPEIKFHPMAGTVLKDKAFKVWFFSGTDGSLHYTTDGTEPLRSSSTVQSEILLQGPSNVIIKSFSATGQYDKVVKAQFAEGSALKSIAKPNNVKPGGLRLNYYEGEWNKLPDFKTLKPKLTTTIDKDFRFEKLPRKENFACLIEGYVEIEEDGYYLFALDSDDGSRLYIGNKLLIDYDGLHGLGNDHSYIVPLTKGFYPIRVEYFQKLEGMNLNLIYITPSTNGPFPKQIPWERMYSQEVKQDL